MATETYVQTPLEAFTPAKAAPQTVSQKISPNMMNLLRSEIVHIKVGPTSVDFGIHKDLICHYSPYFRAAFTSGFEETRTGTMKLPGTLVEVFEIFNQWLYTQNLPNQDHPDLMAKLLRLHIFADMARIPSLANQSLEAVMTVSDETGQLPIGEFRHVWENASNSSVLRKLIIDWIVWDYDPAAEPEDLPDEMLLAAIMAVNKIIQLYKSAATDEIAEPLLMRSNYYVPEQNR